MGTPRVVTDSNNATVWRWEGDAFGSQSPQVETVKMPLRMAGQYFDSESELFYNYFRYYDPKTGRYVTSDPIGLYAGLNTYNYVYGSPLHYRDPDGQNAIALGVGVVAVGAMSLGVYCAVTNCGQSLVDKSVTINTPAVLATKVAVVAVGSMCEDDSEEDRCRKVREECHEYCLDLFENYPESLPGSGHDLFGRMKRCKTECIKAEGCSPSPI